MIAFAGAACGAQHWLASVIFCAGIGIMTFFTHGLLLGFFSNDFVALVAGAASRSGRKQLAQR